MGVTGADVQLSEAAFKLLPVAIECKSKARIAVVRDYEQAQEHAKNGGIAVLVIKENRSNPLIVISLEDFFEHFVRK